MESVNELPGTGRWYWVLAYCINPAVHGQGFHEQTELTALVGKCFMGIIGSQAVKLVKIVILKRHPLTQVPLYLRFNN